MKNTIDLRTGEIRSAWDTDNSKPEVLRRKGEDHLYPFQIWLLKAAPDDVLIKHKGVIMGDWEACFRLPRLDQGVRFEVADKEAKGAREKVVREAGSEVEALKRMVGQMNEFLPSCVGVQPEVWEQMMYWEAQGPGKFGR